MKSLFSILGVVLLVCTTAGAANAFEARDLSAAERSAVRLATDYLAADATSWLEALATDAELRRLSPEEARAEIEVRLGPAAGSTWSLVTPSSAASEGIAAFSISFPSGLEELLELELVEQGGEWKLLRLLISAEPRPEKLSFDQLFEPADSLSPGVPSSLPPAGWLAALAGVVLIHRLLRRQSPRAQLASSTLLSLLLVIGCQQQAPPAPAAESDLTLLGSLRGLRWRTAEGLDAAARESLPPAGVVRDVALLWRIEALIVRSKLNAAATLLQSLPSPSSTPLAELLRGRLATLRGDGEEALSSFTHAQRLGGGHDVLLWEAIQAQALLGEPRLAVANVLYLAETGSRLADIQYLAAHIQLADGNPEQAEASFTAAWELEPRGRDQIFGDPAMAALAARPNIFPLLALEDREEPKVATDTAGTEALPWPEQCVSTLYGRFLLVRFGEATLEVPNGAVVAAADTPVARAGGRRRDDEQAALEWVRAQDGATLGRAGALARKQVALAGRALRRDGAWQQLLDLIGQLPVDGDDQLSTEIVWLRVSALKGLERPEQAKHILVELAEQGIVEDHRDPALLVGLAELFAETEHFDTAIRLLKRASALASSSALDRRIRQLTLDQRLAENYSSHRSRHFNVRYPKATGEKYALEVAHVLEEERQRLRRWIPLADDSRLEVHLFPLDSFFRSYGDEVSVIGIFDGKVRVPFAELRSLHPSLVAVLSHELAHAMITAASGGRAPEWFQEGLAQHIQMADQPRNHLAELRRTSRGFALPVLNPILRGMSEPQFVGLAYNQAAWFVHYLEARAGAAVFGRLTQRFSNGLDTDAALTEVLGASPAAIEEAFWQWGVARAPLSWPTTLRRYDREMALAELKGTHPGLESSSSPSLNSPGLRASTVESRRPAMRRWHAVYSQQARGVKQALGTVLAILGGQADTDLVAACRTLEKRLDALLVDRGALLAPDAAVGRPLRRAFTDFQGASLACQNGRLQTLRDGIARGEARLANAAAALAAYDLQP